MAARMSDEQLRELIVEAYREEALPMATAQIEQSARRRWHLSRRLALPAVASAIAAVAVGLWAVLPHGGGPLPGGLPSTSSTATPAAPSGKPPRPTSSAATAAGRCADYAAAELAISNSLPAADRRTLPPLRFNLILVDRQLSLLLYADEQVEVACWLTPQDASVTVNSSNLTINKPAHPAGQLSNSASAHALEPAAAYSFGRVPAGTTRVEVYFPDNTAVQAQLADGWYVAWATGQASYRFAEITKIVAYTPNQTYVQAVEHG